jgi:uncharacterized protein YndB with AHSA1/START domain
MSQTTGRYEQVNGNPVVRFERTFPHPVPAVWDAITDPEQLEAWFPTTVEFSSLSAGSAIEFRFADDAYPPMTGEVREIRPRELLAFSWGEDELTFELAPSAGGDACRLTFTVVMGTLDKAARDSAGWESCLDMLAQVAAGARPARPAPGGAPSDDWQLYYREYKRQGLPSTAAIPE